ncbi:MULTISPECIES: bifunctional phosphatase PAP2/diacylglycerol kinase family protein [Streptosporangium]|uniref:Undecaprenyl-diphosphatase n=1 Tax=Streptosporangium brasiliense TaxID=47480 RepID=A0ABT9QYT5_9ACTN|nr:phosphatase PAP2 family protein [Streptosporangium brasiliense]MDP9862143.1 undecaprenyl-diphosphatase [Streptosporangium brasiliense]
MRLRSWLGRLDRRLFAVVADARLPGLEGLVPALSRAADNSLLWAGLAGALAVSGRRPLRRAATRGLLAISLASPLVNLVGKQAFGRTRPSLDGLPLARMIKMPASASFPSGHSASAAAFATAVAMEAPGAVAAPVALLAAAVCFSRVYTGVHYPGDVLVGAAIGVATGLATRRLWPEAVTGAPRVVTAPPVPGHDPAGEGVVAVVNPTAGGAPVTAAAVRTWLPEAEVVEADGPDLGELMDGAAARARVLAVAGGDGTVNRGAQAALEHRRPLLVIPGGTLDHFAGALGLRGPEDAMTAYRSGGVVAVDVGEVAGRVFLNNAALGVYPEVVDLRESLEQRVGKWPALLWALGRVLRTAEPEEVIVDGVPRRIWLLFVGNCRYDSRGAAPRLRRRLEDGLLDIRLLTAAPRLPRLRALTSVLLGGLGLSRHYQQWQADTLKVSSSSSGALRLARDGETAVVPGEVEFTKRPRSLYVVRPVG